LFDKEPHTCIEFSYIAITIIYTQGLHQQFKVYINSSRFTQTVQGLHQQFKVYTNSSRFTPTVQGVTMI